MTSLRRALYAERHAPDALRALVHRLRFPRHELIIGLLFGIGGIPALVYQIAWQRILALQSGVGAVSIATIVAAYMAGLGFGNLIGAHLSRRIAPPRALALYATLEAAIGLFGFISPFLYHDLLTQLHLWTNQGQGLARNAILHGLALLPPTTLMGMTFPLLVRAMVSAPETASRTISRLYGLNLLGAAAGAALTPWVLIPQLGGLVPAIQSAAALNLLVALAVLAVARRDRVASTDSTSPNFSIPRADHTRSTARIPFSAWIILYTASGAWALGLELAWFRILDVAAKATAFTFGTLVAVYLGGLAIGSLLGARHSGNLRNPLARFLSCQCFIFTYVGLTTIALVDLSSDLPGLRWLFAYWASYEPLDPAYAPARHIAALYALLPMILFGPPTVAMGYAFAALQAAVQDQGPTSGFKVGILQAANILGCVAGSLLVGFVLFPVLGTAGTLRALVGGGALFAALGLLQKRQRGRFVLAMSLLLAIAYALPDQQRFWNRLHGATGNTLLIDEDETGVIALAPEPAPDPRWRLSVNGKGQSFLPFGGIHSRLGALAAVIHPNPEQIAIIGLGSGDTAWAASCRPETRDVRVFELCGRQPQLLHRLNRNHDLPHLDSFLNDARIHIEEADGRHALNRGQARYDVIEADAIRPNGASSGNLYSLEFYRLCASRLKPGGLMCSWAPTPRAGLTFRRVFPYVLSLDYGQILIGSNQPIPVDRALWQSRLDHPSVRDALGTAVALECQTSLAQANPITQDPPPGLPLNRDLAPLDEYRRQ